MGKYSEQKGKINYYILSKFAAATGFWLLAVVKYPVLRIRNNFVKKSARSQLPTNFNKAIPSAILFVSQV